MKTQELIKSKLPQHNLLTTWRIVEIYKNSRGQKMFYCKASHDTKTSNGFDSIFYEFKESEIDIF